MNRIELDMAKSRSYTHGYEVGEKAGYNKAKQEQPSEELIVKIVKSYCKLYAIETDIEVGDGDGDWIIKHLND